MTSFRQIEANQRNAAKSTGPVTEAGKERSRRNAVRHGLTAETVIATVEDAEDYTLFEAAVMADFDAETAVERELVLRLASLLWRLRRAASIETGMFEKTTTLVAEGEQTAPRGDTDILSHLASRFLHLATEDKGSFERLGRYETALWRQVCQTVFTLEALRRHSLDIRWRSKSRPGAISSFSLSALARR
jgi:hypothetical protein